MGENKPVWPKVSPEKVNKFIVEFYSRKIATLRGQRLGQAFINTFWATGASSCSELFYQTDDEKALKFIFENLVEA